MFLSKYKPLSKKAHGFMHFSRFRRKNCRPRQIRADGSQSTADVSHLHAGYYSEIKQHDDAKHNPVIAECFKVMVSYVFEQEFDGDN